MKESSKEITLLPACANSFPLISSQAPMFQSYQRTSHDQNMPSFLQIQVFALQVLNVRYHSSTSFPGQFIVLEDSLPVSSLLKLSSLTCSDGTLTVLWVAITFCTYFLLQPFLWVLFSHLPFLLDCVLLEGKGSRFYLCMSSFLKQLISSLPSIHIT